MAGMHPANRLITEASPYLRQHAHNPVDWYPWGDEAFERAVVDDKPVLLSIGYSSCHWCHVMERESFDDPGIAGLMNRLFINVKVDREERPDVDEVYMRAVQLLTGRGGWPMTVFLTPDRRPFHAGTYFPPVDRHGLPAFPRVLEAVARAYRERKADVEQSADQLVRGIGALDATEEAPAATLDVGLPGKAASALAEHVDQAYGGLGHAPKFPNAPAFQLLLRRGSIDGRADLIDAARLTARRMAEGGLYDQIGGGFHRYSVDQRWLVPHFEKMLYDNALIPRLYLDVWQVSGDELYGRIVAETLDYVLREMRDETGGFYSATDADSEGEEGRYFVWRPDELRSVLPADDVELVGRYWDITEEGNFEGSSIPHVTVSVEEVARMFERDPADAGRAIRAARGLMYARRQQRVAPFRDEKVLAGWNGLMLGTLARAGRLLGNRAWIDAACRNAEFLWEQMRSGGRLMHTWYASEARIPAFLDDHVFVASGLVELFETTGVREHVDRARRLIRDLEERFLDPDHGDFFFAPSDGERLLGRPKAGPDGAIPSGNGAAASLLLRLYALTGEEGFRDRAERILRRHHPAARKNPFGYVSYLEALEIWNGESTQIVVIGPPGEARDRLIATAGAVFVPNAVSVVAEETASWLPVPARNRQAIDGRPTAYVCTGFTCSPPVTDPAALATLLREPSGNPGSAGN